MAVAFTTYAMLIGLQTALVQGRGSDSYQCVGSYLSFICYDILCSLQCPVSTVTYLLRICLGRVKWQKRVARVSQSAQGLGYGLDVPGFLFQQGQYILTSILFPGTTHVLFNWYQGLFPQVKRPETKFHHPPASRTQVKNVWSYASIPPTCLHSTGEENYTLFLEEKNQAGVVSLQVYC